jgi:hypothetical protein
MSAFTGCAWAELLNPLRIRVHSSYNGFASRTIFAGEFKLSMLGRTSSQNPGKLPLAAHHGWFFMWA